MKSEVSFINEGNDLACGWKQWSTSFGDLLVWHSTELTTSFPGILGWWTLENLWNWGVLTWSTLSLLAVEFDNSSYFLKLFIALLKISECLAVASTFSFFLKNYIEAIHYPLQYSLLGLK